MHEDEDRERPSSSETDMQRDAAGARPRTPLCAADLADLIEADDDALAFLITTGC